MKSFYIVLLITITWTSSLPVQGQDSINIGTRHSLFSNILNEERMYWIYEPEKQPGEEEKRLPGSLLIGWRCIFPFRSRFYPFLCFFKGFFITPLCCSRCFEYRPYQRFHPTSSAARRDGSIQPGDTPKGGGMKAFYRFLTEELRPEIEKKVSANGRNFLVGHSYAGLFTLQVLLDYPESFDTFMAIDPSLWWDRGVFLKQAEKEVGQKDFSGKQLYVAFATRQRPNVKLDQFALADSLGERIIPEMKSQHLRAIYKKFPDEVHGTIALPGMFDGLKSLFMR